MIRTLIDESEVTSLISLESTDHRECGITEAVRRFEKEYILKRLKANDGNITRTAAEIGLERSHLHKKLKRYGIKDG